jgi:hypothetical protein
VKRSAKQSVSAAISGLFYIALCAMVLLGWSVSP